MITRFSTLYVGHIELEQCGLAGAPADSRRYPKPALAPPVSSPPARAAHASPAPRPAQ